MAADSHPGRRLLCLPPGDRCGAARRLDVIVIEHGESLCHHAALSNAYSEPQSHPEISGDWHEIWIVRFE